MQSVHGTVWMVRRNNGTYAKSGSKEGSGYVMFATKELTTQWIIDTGLEGATPFKARFSITPTFTGRTESVVAVHKTRPKVFPATRAQVENNFYP